MFFDGKKEAEKVREELLFSGKLSGKSLLVLQADGGSAETTYVRLKREMGESLGVKVEVVFCMNAHELRRELDPTSPRLRGASGVLVQLPIIGADRKETQAILDLIPEGKDVDGLTTLSRFLPAVVKAVDRVLIYAWATLDLRFSTAAVVGAEGTMGRRLVKWLEERALQVERYDKGDDFSKLSAGDVIVGATGVAGLIRAEMVKNGAIAIDLGYPQGDFVFDEVRQKTSLITPVPGGIGPLTVVCLFENLAQV